MFSPSALLALGAGSIVAVMFGVSLGNSAISQINPVYFQGAAVHPRDRGAALDPNAPTVIPNRYEQLYGFDQGQQARAADCVGCAFGPPTIPAGAGIYAASVPYFGSREEQARIEAREQREIDAEYQRRLDEARAHPATDEVGRHAHYRVSEDEVVRDPPLDAAGERPYYARNDVVLGDEGGDDQK